jgi:hypothetical protein
VFDEIRLLFVSFPGLPSMRVRKYEDSYLLLRSLRLFSKPSDILVGYRELSFLWRMRRSLLPGKIPVQSSLTKSAIFSPILIYVRQIASENMFTMSQLH